LPTSVRRRIFRTVGRSGSSSDADGAVSPVVLRSGPHRIDFCSHEPNEPPRVHVDRDDLSAKFWLERVGLAYNLGFSAQELRRVERVIHENQPSRGRRWQAAASASTGRMWMRT
jgi:hypothetical protein